MSTRYVQFDKQITSQTETTKICMPVTHPNPN